MNGTSFLEVTDRLVNQERVTILERRCEKVYPKDYLQCLHSEPSEAIAGNQSFVERCQLFLCNFAEGCLTELVLVKTVAGAPIRLL